MGVGEFLDGVRLRAFSVHAPAAGRFRSAGSSLPRAGAVVFTITLGVAFLLSLRDLSPASGLLAAFLQPADIAATAYNLALFLALFVVPVFDNQPALRPGALPADTDKSWKDFRSILVFSGYRSLLLVSALLPFAAIAASLQPLALSRHAAAFILFAACAFSAAVIARSGCRMLKALPAAWCFFPLFLTFVYWDVFLPVQDVSRPSILRSAFSTFTPFGALSWALHGEASPWTKIAAASLVMLSMAAAAVLFRYRATSNGSH